MGYRVDYQPIQKVRRMEKRIVRVPALAVLCFLLFLLMVNCMWPQGSAVLRKVIFPGDIAVTVAALDELAETLQNGASLQNALYAFCQSVIREGSVA